MLGIFVEPEECFRRRLADQRQRQEQEGRQRLARMDDLLTELVIEALGEPGDPPMPITKAVNIVGKRLQRCFNEEIVAAKKRAFQKIGFLIKIRRLTRIRRNSVCIPETDEGYRAFLDAMEAKIQNMPGPNL
ncbi:MAG: hypothetical protein RL514_3 [Verrucomicrobiota bacterium]|jgi:protoporphyrinogen oxidase